MEALPHDYSVIASAEATGNVVVSGTGLPPLHTGPPVQFGGPGGQWSPETMLVAAAADCYILTFRAIARASHLPWTALRCAAEGRLDRVDGVTRFTGLVVRALLTVPAGTDGEKARRLLAKAETSCLIANSLAFTPTLSCEIATAEDEEIVIGQPEKESLESPSWR